MKQDLLLYSKSERIFKLITKDSNYTCLTRYNKTTFIIDTDGYDSAFSQQPTFV